MLIVGLGNPGSKYEKNKHNVGWMQLKRFAQKAHLSFTLDKKHKAEVARGSYQGKTITLVMPLTYMNLSGESVLSIAEYYKYSPEEILVIYDDKDFDLGNFKIKVGGSSAGHNGIKSLISCLKTDKFIRFRIGIGPKPKEFEMANFVLSDFSKEDLKILDLLFDKGVEAIETVIFQGLENAMQLYNRKS